MRPARINALRWIAPTGMMPATFQKLRPRLESLLDRSPGDPIYSVNTRSIYRASDPVTGPVAIKELRFESRSARLRATTTRRHRVLCEFHAQAVFCARGGHTPSVLGAALEFDGPIITRVFILTSFIDTARTLTEAIRAWEDNERSDAFAALARELVASAKLGLVHGRHSSENILVTDRPRAFRVIDFSHAQLYRHYEPHGFTCDVARIGARLIVEQACPRSTVEMLFEAVTRAAPDGTVSTPVLWAEFDAVLDNSKRRQRLTRQYRTFWRGWPFRLRQGP